MKHHKHKLIITLFAFGTLFSHSQERKLKKANKRFKKIAYLNATKKYLDVAKAGYRSEELFKKLGDTYYYNAKYDNAAKWYGELFVFAKNVSPANYYLRYSQSLKAVGKDSISVIWFNKYIVKAGLSDKEFSSANDYMQIIEKDSDLYTMQPVSINTGEVDFGGSFLGENLVFTSTNKRKSDKMRSGWDGLPYFDIYQALIDKDGSLGKPVKLKGDVNTKYHHESSAIFTKDGKTMYFTRNNTTPIGKRRKKDTQHLKIYRAHLVGDEWTNIESLTINGDDYSTAHPALNFTENTLYFASNMPQSLGQTDLFMASISQNGTLGKPVNLGEKINTKGRESFPYITADNELYFSSDGHYGIGGYDVFRVKLKENGYADSLLNVGKPINSAFDDIAFTIKDNKGYISSNRPGGNGFDDIYRFEKNKPIISDSIIKHTIDGIVTNGDNQPLANAIVGVFSETEIKITQAMTDENGRYNLDFETIYPYTVKATKDNFYGSDKYLTNDNNSNKLDFILRENVVGASKNDDLSSISNTLIYFDYNESSIQPDAEVKLQEIIAFMKQKPITRIEVRSHTDSRGSASYNMALSQQRSNSAIKYIIEKGGVSSNRLTGKGYGYTQLINDCKKSVKCSNQMHEANRRSEFIVSDLEIPDNINRKINDNNTKNHLKNSNYNKQEVINAIVNSNALAHPSLSKGYYLISNVFSSNGNTIEWEEFLKSKKKSPTTFFNPLNNLHYVSIFNNEDIDQVYNKYSELSELPYLEKLWILKINTL